MGLPCRKCGQKVLVKQGLFVLPVTPEGEVGEPWARHLTCR